MTKNVLMDQPKIGFFAALKNAMYSFRCVLLFGLLSLCTSATTASTVEERSLAAGVGLAGVTTAGGAVGATDTGEGAGSSAGFAGVASTGFTGGTALGGGAGGSAGFAGVTATGFTGGTALGAGFAGEGSQVGLP